MERYILLFLLIVTAWVANAQKVVFGSSPMMTKAEANRYDMRKLLNRSYWLPFTLSDSTADTTLIRIVDSIHSKADDYCVLFKDDTTRAAIEIKRLYPGFEVTAYWKSMGKKRISHYTSRYILTWTYCEYFENGKLKVTGNYLNNKKDGKWTYYNADGNKTSVTQYNQGVLVPARK